MSKMLITRVSIAIALISGFALAQQVDPGQVIPPRVPKPAPKLTFTDRMKSYLQRTGSTVDETKSTPDMVVSTYPDAKGGKVTIVLVNDRRRNLLGFYIYNFGSLKGAANKDDVYKYLLAANDSITIGSFFIDGDDDIGYKYLVSSAQAMNQAAFDYAYFTMAAVARERKPEIKKLLGPVSDKDEKPPEVKKAAEEKPPEGQEQTEDAIREAVFRYMFEHDAVQQRPYSKAFFIGVDGKDPSDAFIRRFDEQQPVVKRISQSTLQKDGAFMVVDSATGEGGVRYTVGVVKWISAHEAKLGGGYHVAPLFAGGCEYQIVQRGREWLVTGCVGGKWVSRSFPSLNDRDDPPRTIPLLELDK